MRSVCGVYFVLFFFFKQKTAYEMRISDWSSDVCSSDLVAPQHRDLIARAVRTWWAFGGNGDEGSGLIEALEREGAREARAKLVEIGRASCRERVCQYV